MNLTEQLDHSANLWPEKPALIEGEEVVTYAALKQRVAELAASIQMLGLPAGCRVGLSYPNSISYVALTCALWRVSAVVVPIPTECTEDEIVEISETMQLQAILSDKPRNQSALLT